MNVDTTKGRPNWTRWFGVLWLVGICWLGYNAISKELVRGTLILEGQTVPGFIIETWREVAATDDETNRIVYDHVAKYKYRVPDGREFIEDTFISNKLRKKIANEGVWPYPIEVQFLPSDPTVSVIKGEGHSIAGWIFGELGILIIFLCILSIPGILWVRRVETPKEKQKNSRIFIWKAFSEWRSVLEDMYRDILTPELEAKVRQSATDIKHGDDTETFEKLSGHLIDSMITTEKINEFRQRYSHIRVYHGCRTTDVQSYREKGLLLLSKDEQIERFRSIFLRGGYPELTEEMLKQSIQEVASLKKDAESDLCLGIDDKFIIKYCGHYLIYGCEYLGNLVSQLPVENIEKYRAVLRKIGKPTLIEINLPNTTKYNVEDNNIWELISEMLTGWAYCLSHSRTQPHRLDSTVTLFEPLPPEYICSCYHPIKIIDPFMRYKIYDAKTGEYEDSET